MSEPHIHNRYRTVPASLLLQVLGNSLEDIKSEDNATDADLGAVLGKHEDTAGRYRTALAEMGVVAFLRGCRQWDGRFANAVLALVGMKLCPIEARHADDQVAVTTLLRLTVELSTELERDGDISDEDLHTHRFLIEAVGGLVDGFRHRLRTKAIESG